MAPPKRTAAEANLLDDLNPNPLAKQKLAAQAHLARAGGRRGNSTVHAQAVTNGNGYTNGVNGQVNNVHASLKDLANMSEAIRATEGAEKSGLEFVAEPRSLLLSYRDTFAIPSQTCYSNPSAHLILASGIGHTSPTMARHASKRRCTKEELASSVKRHFKDTAVQEPECLVEVTYRVRTKDKAFRLKFWPKPAR